MKLVRYADEFVVMVHGTRDDAEALRDEVSSVLAPMGLRLSESKTRICYIDEGFDFLGWRIQPVPGEVKKADERSTPTRRRSRWLPSWARSGSSLAERSIERSQTGSLGQLLGQDALLGRLKLHVREGTGRMQRGELLQSFNNIHRRCSSGHLRDGLNSSDYRRQEGRKLLGHVSGVQQDDLAVPPAEVNN